MTSSVGRITAAGGSEGLVEGGAGQQGVARVGRHEQRAVDVAGGEISADPLAVVVGAGEREQPG